MNTFIHYQSVCKIIEIGIFLGLHKASNYIWQWLILEENFSNILLLPHSPEPMLETPQYLFLSATTSYLLPPELKHSRPCYKDLCCISVRLLSYVDTRSSWKHTSLECPYKVLRGVYLAGIRKQTKLHNKAKEARTTLFCLNSSWHFCESSISLSL